MGKSSKKKIQKESRAKPLLKDKPLEAEETSVKWSLFRNPFFHLILITIIGLIAYSNTFTVPFHFDDTSNIVENYKLKDLNNYWPPTGSRWFGFLTFALNYHFGGLNTVNYHIVNLTIHIINALLVYWLVMLTFRTPYFSTNNPPSPPFSKGGMGGFALFSSLLFVSHPIQTQAVTYIVQRFTSLATMFYLLSLVMYIKFRIQRTEDKTQNTEKKLDIPNTTKEIIGNSTSSSSRLVRNPSSERFPTSGNDTKCGLTYGFLSKYAICHLSSVIWYLGSVFSAVLAMKTKEISFTLPVIITLYEFMFFEGKSKKRLLYLIPLLLTMLIIPLSLVGIDKPIGDTIGELREAAQETEEILRWSYLFTQLRVIVTYIRLLFLPINQNLDYDYPIYHSFFESEVFLSFLFLLLIFGIGVCLFYRSRISHPEPKAKGLRDSSATPQTCPERDDEILPLNQVQGQNDRKRRNDINIPTRYTLYATRLIAFGILWFFITLSVESSIIPIRDVINEHRLYLPGVGIIIAFTSSVFYVLQFTIHRSRIFTSYFPLPTSYFLLMSTLVIALSITTYQRNIVWKDEVSLWEEVVRKSPNKARGYNNLGKYYLDKKWMDKAIEHFQTALRLKPDYPEAYNNLGSAYSEKGLIDKAIEYYQIALRLKPDYPEAYNNLGIAYYDKGLVDEAIEHYQIAIRLKPDNADFHYNLGIAYYNKGLVDEAIEHYQIAVRLRPDADFHNNLGIAYKAKGLPDKAIEHYQIALNLKPDGSVIHFNLGIIYLENGFTDKARNEFVKALQINPNDNQARQILNSITQTQKLLKENDRRNHRD